MRLAIYGSARRVALYPPPISSYSRGMRSEILVEPRDDTTEAICEVFLFSEAVTLAWVHDELRRDAVAFEATIEFLALAQRVDDVVFALQDECGGAGVLDVGDRRAAAEAFGFFVRETVEPFVVRWVVFRAVLGGEVGQAGARDGGLEARRLRDRPLGHVAAVGPAGDAESG